MSFVIHLDISRMAQVIELSYEKEVGHFRDKDIDNLDLTCSQMLGQDNLIRGTLTFVRQQRVQKGRSSWSLIGKEEVGLFRDKSTMNQDLDRG